VHCSTFLSTHLLCCGRNGSTYRKDRSLQSFYLVVNNAQIDSDYLLYFEKVWSYSPLLVQHKSLCNESKR
jgi:hypothetical protein